VTFREAEEALDAIKRGEADAAFVWGPSAGAHNKRQLGDAYQIIPVAGEGMQWQVVIGVRPSEAALLQRLNGAIDALQVEIGAVMVRYGFPSGNPVPINVKLLSQAPPPRDSARIVQTGLVPVQAQPTEVAKASSGPEAVSAGKSEFNQHCSHCHAPNAMSFEPTRDLRRLRIRYGNKMREVAYATIVNGRNDKGMPVWKGVIAEDKIEQILAFLESVQRSP
jgi:mono/diheme cytochrome c family protein